MNPTRSAEPVSKILNVAGAALYTEVQGEGPCLLMIAGGPADAGVFRAVAAHLSAHFKVITYDPRGNSRSVFDAEPDDLDMNVMGNDAAIVMAAFTDQPAFVFGNSGGAQIALNLTARYPHMVQKLIAHEPPCIALLPDRAALTEKMSGVTTSFRNDGPKAAMKLFSEMTGAAPPPPETADTQSRIRSNLPYFLGQAAQAIADYVPDIERLRPSASKIVVGAGASTAGQMAHRTAEALSKALPAPLVEFPGGHGGFSEFPQEFALKIYQVLNA